jgi:hypothetical protein
LPSATRKGHRPLAFRRVRHRLDLPLFDPRARIVSAPLEANALEPGRQRRLAKIDWHAFCISRSSRSSVFQGIHGDCPERTGRRFDHICQDGDAGGVTQVLSALPTLLVRRDQADSTLARSANPTRGATGCVGGAVNRDDSSKVGPIVLRVNRVGRSSLAMRTDRRPDQPRRHCGRFLLGLRKNYKEWEKVQPTGARISEGIDKKRGR